MNNFKYFLSKLSFLKVFFSPFKFFIPKFYIGKKKIGIPYFLPRRWVKSNKKGVLKSKPKLIGFDFLELGYKTKWSELDYRFEWSPIWSFVFFGIQIAIIFKPIEQEHYWVCWLIYENHTDKTKTKFERIKQAKELYPCIWRVSSGGVETSICYWDVVLKKKYVTNN